MKYLTPYGKIGERRRKKMKQDKRRRMDDINGVDRRRKYVVYFKMNTEFEGKYDIIPSQNLESAFYDAIKIYGQDVARCAIANDYEMDNIKFRKYQPLNQRR